MKLVYHIKFRAFGITFGTQSGEVDLRTQLSPALFNGLADYIGERGYFMILVQDRGVYIGIELG
jgi:hypothetical protein